MKVSLKNARLLAKNLDALINVVSQKYVAFNRSLSLSDFQDPTNITLEEVEPIYRGAIAELVDATDKTVAMVEVVHSLRNKVAAVNAANGINEKVARTAYLNRMMGVYTNLIRQGESNVVTDIEHNYLVKLVRKIVTTAKGPVDPYSRHYSVQIQLLSEDQLRSYKKKKLQLSQELEAIRADLARTNSALEIELSDSEICVLEYHSLL